MKALDFCIYNLNYFLIRQIVSVASKRFDFSFLSFIVKFCFHDMNRFLLFLLFSRDLKQEQQSHASNASSEASTSELSYASSSSCHSPSSQSTSTARSSLTSSDRSGNPHQSPFKPSLTTTPRTQRCNLSAPSTAGESETHLAAFTTRFSSATRKIS